jgi:hypothetical protein
VERLPDPFGELLPDVLADQVGGVAPEHLAGLRVDVEVDPVGAECDEGVADALEQPIGPQVQVQVLVRRTSSPPVHHGSVTTTWA